ncbi:tRNA (guanosine(37)-N1)-methyltransferase TrmD [Ornithinimicrobium sediminis]|uniref:tRNA (guanosine(37)-N1)-methyltransferase TrmD n=1 Tax=Ornithinimicrobium sediminis TaxID=2904603 RepID=UPI001E3400B5|nr:tRNA (guanosine(37)-N1)-methyltransferase TrmD [Ornithinimicrobium sediminis]
MRIDVISIFPDYLSPLGLSLIGKARRQGLLDVRTHDLRAWTRDRHRTVDDTPYGGGAGMVMRPEPWGEAIDEVSGHGEHLPRIVVPGPGGVPFSQAMAAELAAEPWLVFACGRYEGIDERVYDEYGERLSTVSLGDYVLNGGEVAVLAMVEALARLVPGVIGNVASLAEESHTGGLLEYPVYTKPPVWRGRKVPDVLRSGDHGAVAAWRDQQRRERTAARRPDLLAAALPASVTTLAGVEGLALTTAVPADAGEILTLSRACWLEEGRAHDSFAIPALVEDLDTVREDLTRWHTWVLRSHGRLIGSVRARQEDGLWDIGRLMVAPDLQGRRLGRALLEHAEQSAPEQVSTYGLVTGARSVDNLRMYRRAGYRVVERSDFRGVPTVRLTKPRRR